MSHVGKLFKKPNDLISDISYQLQDLDRVKLECRIKRGDLHTEYLNPVTHKLVLFSIFLNWSLFYFLTYNAVNSENVSVLGIFVFLPLYFLKF
jgi:hypothetical protein